MLAEGFAASWIGWTLLGVGTAGFILAVAGLSVTRTRGEMALAFAALALALSFSLFVSPFFLYGFAGE